MYFNTLQYYVFFLATFLLLRYSSKPTLIAIAASVVFYIVAGWFDTALIAFVILCNWVLLRTVTNGRLRVLLAVLFNIGVLAAIKYRVFLLGVTSGEHAAFVDTVLPLGISFYTFQLLAYQIDTHRVPQLREQNPHIFVLFIIFFPQLIAGPIVRAKQLLPQLRGLLSGHRRLKLYTYGLALCALGLVKKVFFADSLAPIVDDIFALGPQGPGEAWLGAWLFTFQIYFDFSGYSDIAIGSAYLLGIRLPRNFRTPYMSRNPREFWQRWHITLSTWIRDYLYIPLGGNRGTAARQFFLLLFVMGTAGLWHGANVTFIAWGVLWGLYIALHRVGQTFLGTAPRIRRYTESSVGKLALWSLHMIVIVCLWVFFRASNVNLAVEYLLTMFSLPTAITIQDALIVFGCLCLVSLHYVEAAVPNLGSRMVLRRWNRPVVWGFFIGLMLWLVLLPSYTQNPFIYFRF